MNLFRRKKPGRRRVQPAPFGFGPGSASCLLALEPRIMYDGAGAISAFDLSDGSASGHDGGTNDLHADTPARDRVDTILDLFKDYQAQEQNAPREIIFVSSSVKDYQQLLAGITTPNCRVVILAPNSDAMEQISAELGRYHELDAIHLISHGSPGSVQFETGDLNLENLETYRQQLKGWGQALATDGDILIYGCDVAAGQKGEEFMARISALTDAEVAASDDLTGHGAFGGDWDLEVQTGHIEALLPFSTRTVQDYNHVLAPPQITAGTNMDYTENDAAAPIAPLLEVTDVDDIYLQGAVVKITHAYAPDQDILSFADTAAITSTYNPATGVLSLTGMDTVQNYQDALRNITYRNSSDNPVVLPRVAEFTVTDGSGASSNASTTTVSIFAVNDAPLLDSVAFPAMTPIAEDDRGNSGQDLTGLLSGRIIDVDAGAVQGIAVTWADTSNGAWQYSLDSGGSWQSFSALSESSATLLTVAPQSRIRFLPNQDFNGSADIMFRAWDRTDGLYPGAKADVSVNGGTTSFSTATAGAGITVTPLNDPPLITAALASLNYRENDAATPLAPSVLLNDIDSANLASATIKIDTGFRQDQDILSFADTATITSNWEPASATLTLLGSDTAANYQAALRQVMYRNLSDSPEITSRTVMFAVSDGALASNTGGMAITVTAVNDAPLFDTSGFPALTPIIEDDRGNPGQALLDLVSGRITDADVGAAPGVAVTWADTSSGNWQYSLDNGGSWQDFGILSETSATLLHVDSLSRIRFLPNQDFDGTAGIRFRAWDQSDGKSAGDVADVSVNGGSTPFSAATATAAVSITPVNDPPLMTAVGTTLAYTENDAATAVAPSLLLRDVDDANLEGAVITIATGFRQDQDILSFTDTTSITSKWDPASATLTLLGSDTVANYQAALQQVLYRNSSESPEVAPRTVTFSVTDGALVGNTGNAAITVTSVNDAPVLDNSGFPALPLIIEDDRGNSGQALTDLLSGRITDADAGALPGIAVTGADSGHGLWQYSLDNGGSWQDAGVLSEASAILLPVEPQTRIRFLPNQDFDGTAGIMFRAWDRTDGKNPGDVADVSTNGGSASFSATIATATVTITPVNDAPVMTGGGTIMNYRENDAATAVAPSLLLADVDDGNLEGAVIKIAPGFQQDQDILSFAGTAAITSNWDPASATLTLSGSDTVANYQAALQQVLYRNSSESPEVASRTVSFTVSDGALASNSQNAVVTVTSVNDAPVLDTAGFPALLPISEDDRTNSGQALTSLLAGRITDADAGALQGIAVTGADSGNGAWQYSPDNGGSWQNFGSLSETAATLLNVEPQTRVRFLPNQDFNGTAGIMFRAWDRSDGKNAGAAVDASLNGGSTAFSAAVASAGITVTSVNDAPRITGADATMAYTENAAATPVAPSLLLTDIDSGNLTGAVLTIAAGFAPDQDVLSFADTVAITSNWDQASATLTLLGSDTVANYQAALRQVLYHNSNEAPQVAPRTVMFTVSDGLLESNTGSAIVTVAAVNDAPVLDNAGFPALPSVFEDDRSNSGQPLTSLLDGRIADADAGALSGIAVTAADTGNGGWQYSLDSGGSWQDFGALSENAATLLSVEPQTRIRFLPNQDFNGSAGITFRAWDRSDGRSAGAKADVSANGGNTSFSTAVATTNLAVIPVNDPPRITGGGASLNYTENEAATVVTTSLILSDVDSAMLQGAVIKIASGFALSQDVLAFSDTAAIRSVWNPSTGALILSGSDTVQNYQLALKNITYKNLSDSPLTTPREIQFTASDGTDSSSAAVSTISLIGVNDAPLFSDNLVTFFSAINEDEVDNRGNLVADLIRTVVLDPDQPSLGGIAITSVDNSNGIWQYSLDNGSSWRFFGPLSDSSATLLAAVPETRVRFVPKPNFYGASSITFHAWDRTDNRAGGTLADISQAGGSTSFSVAGRQGIITVTSRPEPGVPLTSSTQPVVLAGKEIMPISPPRPRPEAEANSLRIVDFSDTAAPPKPESSRPDKPLPVETKAERAPKADAHSKEGNGKDDSPETTTDEQAAQEEANSEEEEQTAEEAEAQEETASEEPVAAAPVAEGAPAGKTQAAPLKTAEAKEAGLSGQLSQEGAQAAAERAEILQIFKDVYQLLQCK